MAAIDLNDLQQRYQDLLNQLQGQYSSARDNAYYFHQQGNGGLEQTYSANRDRANSTISTAKQNYQDIANLVQQGAIDSSQLDTVMKAIQGDSVAKQTLTELANENTQRQQANQQLSDLRDNFETQIFGDKGLSLQDALNSTGGELGQLSQALQGQQDQVFQRNLAPMINRQMLSQGLIDSGANVEQQAKALAGLEQGRQSTLLDAALGAKSQLQGLQQSQVMGDIGAQQSALSNAFDLQRTGLTMQFQQQLEQQRADLALELSQYHGGGGASTLQQVLGGVGMAGSIAAAPFTGGMSLAALPGFTGMTFGSGGAGAAQGGAQGAAALGSSFFSQAPQYGINNSGGYKGYAPGYPTYASMGPSWNG